MGRVAILVVLLLPVILAQVLSTEPQTAAAGISNIDQSISARPEMTQSEFAHAIRETHKHLLAEAVANSALKSKQDQNLEEALQLNKPETPVQEPVNVEEKEPVVQEKTVSPPVLSLEEQIKANNERLQELTDNLKNGGHLAEKMAPVQTTLQPQFSVPPQSLMPPPPVFVPVRQIAPAIQPVNPPLFVAQAGANVPNDLFTQVPPQPLQPQQLPEQVPRMQQSAASVPTQTFSQSTSQQPANKLPSNAIPTMQQVQPPQIIAAEPPAAPQSVSTGTLAGVKTAIPLRVGRDMEQYQSRSNVPFTVPKLSDFLSPPDTQQGIFHQNMATADKDKGSGSSQSSGSSNDSSGSSNSSGSSGSSNDSSGSSNSSDSSSDSSDSSNSASSQSSTNSSDSSSSGDDNSSDSISSNPLFSGISASVSSQLA